MKRLSDQMPLEYDRSAFSKMVEMSWVSSQHHQGDGEAPPRDFVHQAARSCDADDFAELGFDSVYKEISDQSRKAMLCPGDLSSLYLKNNQMTHKGKKAAISTKFIVDRCSQLTNPECLLDDEVEKELSTFYFEVHHVVEKLDFEKTGDMPPVRVKDEMISILQFSHEKYEYMLSPLRKNDAQVDHKLL